MGECLAVLFSLSALPACEQPETRTLAGELDYVLENKGVFDRKREERIDELRRTLHVTGLSPRQEYEINARLCDEFWKYKLDSAIRYAERNLAIARQLHDTPETYTSGLRLAQLYSFPERASRRNAFWTLPGGKRCRRLFCRSITRPTTVFSATMPPSATRRNTTGRRPCTAIR